MRGHGTVNVRFAFESQMDEICAKLNLDPAAVRRINLLKPPTITVNGLRVLSYGLPECIDKVIDSSDWAGRKGKLPKGRGLGMACSHYVSGAANSIIRSDMPHSTVNIKIDRDGGVVVYTGASDIGQGSDTMTAQVVAEVLGCDLSRVRVIAADTDLTPIDLGSYSSRVTFMAGNAALRAAQDVKKNIVSAAAKRMDCAPEDVIMRNDRVYKRGAVPATTIPARQRFLEKMDAPRGRVDGQILRGSVLQTRKEEAPKEHMSFEEAVVSAIDFHGGSDGNRLVRARRLRLAGQAQRRRRRPVAGILLFGAGRRSQRRRGDRRSDGPQDLGRPRLWARAESGGCRRPGDRFRLDGAWAGAGRRDDLERRAADESGTAGIPQPILGGIARDRMLYRRKHRSRGTVWRERSGRRLAGSHDSGDLKRYLRRCGSPTA